MSFYRLFLSVLIVAFAPSCTDSDNNQRVGTIMFTSTHDCDIRLFDNQCGLIAREYYEVGKDPVIFYMKNAGIYIVHAICAITSATYKKQIDYRSGNVEYCIEF